MAPRSILRPVVAAAALLSTVAIAQQPAPQQAPILTVTPAPTPSPTAAAPPVVLATPTLTPRPGIDDVPTPVFIPNPRPTAPRPTSSPIPAPPTATTSPAAVATPVVRPSVAPTPVTTPSSSATGIARPAIETVILPQPRTVPLWLWVLGGAALLLVIFGWLGLRRQHDGDDDAWNDEAEDEAAFEKEPPAGPVVAALPVATRDGAHLAVTLHPTRAGLNLISATAECEVTLVNIGNAVAEDIRVALRLMSARDGQDAELAAFYAHSGGRPATPPFTLEPGGEHRLRAVTAVPHDAIHSIEARGRPMFVPLLALSIRYRDGDGPHRIGQAFMLGVEQGDAAKLAPFWLDGPARTYDHLAARLHGEMVED